jgi:hypothetical protein
MSSYCVGEVFKRYPAGGGEFALALALADNAHDDGTHIYPGLAHMAHKSRQNERSVQRHLKAMLDIGWLVLVAKSTRGKGNEYRISPRWLRGDSLSPQSGGAPGPDTGDNLSPQSARVGVTNATRTGDKRDTPYKNRKNHSPPTPPSGGRSRRRRVQGEGEIPPGLRAVAEVYPALRVDLVDAAGVWASLAPDEAAQAAILAAVRCRAKQPDWQREGGKFAWKLSKWLRKRGWQDPAAQAVEPPPMVLALPALPAWSPEQAERARQHAATAREKLGLPPRKVGVPA